MMRAATLTLVLLMTSSAWAQLLPTLGGQRVGISSLTYLKNDLSPRSVGMSGANLTLLGDGMSLFHNPANMARLGSLSIAAANLQLGAATQQSWLSASAPLPNKTSVAALSINHFSTGAMAVRTEFRPEGTGQLFYAVQSAIGLAYAQQLSDRFCFGVHLKYVREQLAQYTTHAAAADLGFLYTTDRKGFKFGIVVQNFGGNTRAIGQHLAVDFGRDSVTTDRFSVPTVFKLGASIVPWQSDVQSLTVAAQLEHPFDNSENVRLGVEYERRKLLFLRTGIKLNVTGQAAPTVGIGFRPRFGKHRLMVNYAVNPTRYLGTLHSFGLDFTLNTDKRDE